MILFLGQDLKAFNFVTLVGIKRDKMDFRRKILEAHWKKRGVLLKGQSLFQFLVTAINGDPIAFDVSRKEERKTLDVVPVKMGQEDVKVA